MKKQLLGIVLILGLALNGHAQVTSSVGLAYLSDYKGVDLGAVVGSLGYRFQGQNGWSFQPEFRIGAGVIDDTARLFSMSAVALVPVDVEIDYLLGAAGRIQYQVDGGVYFFAQPTLTRFEIDAGNVTASWILEDTEWEFGADIGAGFQVSERFGLEAAVGVIDGDTIVNAGVRFDF